MEFSEQRKGLKLRKNLNFIINVSLRNTSQAKKNVMFLKNQT